MAVLIKKSYGSEVLEFKTRWEKTYELLNQSDSLDVGFKSFGK